jgi:hypothetical protein
MADQALGRLDGSIHTLPDPDLFACMYVRKEDVDEVVNYAHAMNHGLARLEAQTIDPFLDGNGRIGRLLITFRLCERRALHEPELHLSHFLKVRGIAEVSAKQVQALVGTTFTAANQIVRRLVNLGVLVEITGQARHRRFRYDAYVKL